MRKLLVAVALILMLAVGASAQSPKICLYAGGGMGLPMSPEVFSDGWKAGLNFGGGVGYLASPQFEVGGTLYYNSFGLDVPSGVGIDGGSFTSLEIMANFKYLIAVGAEDASFKPYLLGKIGMATVDVTDITLTEGEYVYTMGVIGETKLAYGFGAGADIAISPKAAVFFQTNYTFVATSGESMSYLPFSAGIKFWLGGE